MKRSTGLKIGQGSLAFAGAALNAYGNSRQGAHLASATRDGYRIRRQNYANQVNAATDYVGGLNDETVGAKNDRLFEYREKMGAIRVAAAAQGASGASADAQLREAGGRAGLDINRLDANNQRQRASVTRSLLDARSGLQIANKQAYQNAKAEKSALGLNSLGGFIQAGSSIASMFTPGA